MNTDTEFLPKHVALYAKLHYQRSDNVWNDVMICLKADGYEPYSHGDVLGILTRNMAKLNDKPHEHYMQCFIDGISPQNYSRHGYYTYDYQTAILWYYLSELQGMLISK